MLNVGDKILLRGDIKPSTCVSQFKDAQNHIYYWFENPLYEGRFFLTDREVEANRIMQ